MRDDHHPLRRPFARRKVGSLSTAAGCGYEIVSGRTSPKFRRHDSRIPNLPQSPLVAASPSSSYGNHSRTRRPNASALTRLAFALCPRPAKPRAARNSITGRDRTVPRAEYKRIRRRGGAEAPTSLLLPEN